MGKNNKQKNVGITNPCEQLKYWSNGFFFWRKKNQPENETKIVDIIVVCGFIYVCVDHYLHELFLHLIIIIFMDS